MIDFLDREGERQKRRKKKQKNFFDKKEKTDKIKLPKKGRQKNWKNIEEEVDVDT